MIPLRDTQPSYGKPLITAAIIAINILIFLYEFSLEPFSQNHFIAAYAIVPAKFQYMNLITSMFLHGGWMHLIGNMWFLWIYGDNVEDVLGHSRFLLFYLLCGIVAGMVQVAASPDSRIPTIGASGAIAGVMGAYLIKFPHSRIVTLVPIFIFFTTMEIPAVFMLLYWFVIQLFSGVGSIGTSNVSHGGVAWFAHIGGFLAGMVLIKVMGTEDRYRNRREYHWR